MSEFSAKIIEIEMLSALIAYPKIQRVYARKLKTDDFSEIPNKKLFEKILESQDGNLSYDQAMALQDGFKEIIFHESIALPNPENWFEILRQLSVKRMIYSGLIDVSSSLSHDFATDILKNLSEISMQSRRLLTGNSNKTMSDIISEFVTDMEAVSGDITGLEIFGIKELDFKLNGANKGDLILLAGRPGMGKTAHTIDILSCAIDLKLSLKYYSLEMTNTQIIQRLMANRTDMCYSDISRGRITHHQQYQTFIEDLRGSKISFVDKSMTWDEIESDAIASSEDEDIDIIVIDYAQLIRNAKGQSDYEAVTNVARGAKNLAKNLSCPVFLLSQLNRALETRGGFKIPIVSDLKQSGALEENADKILFYYRPSEYGFILSDAFTHINVGDHKDAIIVAKNRGGENCLVTPATFNPLSMTWATNISNFEKLKPVDFGDINPF